MICTHIRNPVAIALIVLFACIVISGPARAESKIDTVLIVSETTDLVVLEVHYQYDGSAQQRARMRAHVLGNGKVSPHHVYTPGPVSPGRHRTRVEITTGRQPPAVLESNGIRVTLHAERDREPVATRTVAFAKTWAKPRTALRPPPAQARARPTLAAPVSRSPLRPTVTPLKSRLELLAAARRQNGIAPMGSLKTPSGTTVVYSHAQPATPPDSAPDLQHQLWAQTEAERLLDIIGTLLGNDAGALNWYKSTEGGDTSPYALISRRTDAIAVMVADEE